MQHLVELVVSCQLEHACTAGLAACRSSGWVAQGRPAAAPAQHANKLPPRPLDCAPNLRCPPLLPLPVQTKGVEGIVNGMDVEEWSPALVRQTHRRPSGAAAPPCAAAGLAPEPCVPSAGDLRQTSSGVVSAAACCCPTFPRPPMPAPTPPCSRSSCLPRRTSSSSSSTTPAPWRRARRLPRASCSARRACPWTPPPPCSASSVRGGWRERAAERVAAPALLQWAARGLSCTKCWVGSACFAPPVQAKQAFHHWPWLLLIHSSPSAPPPARRPPGGAEGRGHPAGRHQEAAQERQRPGAGRS